MATVTYDHTTETALIVESCRHAAQGDLLDVHLDSDTFPLLPDSIRAVIQLVDGLTYTLQYEDDDLNGGAAELTETIITELTFVTELNRSVEYVDEELSTRDTTIAEIQAALVNLGVLPQAGDNLFVIQSDTYEHVSIPVYQTLHETVIAGGGNATITVEPEILGEALSLADLVDYTFRVDIDVSVASSGVVDGLHGSYKYVYIGRWDQGGVIDTVYSNVGSGATVTAVKSGNNISIGVVNSGPTNDVNVFVSSKFQTLNYTA